MKKKSMTIKIEYECKKGYLCPICIEEGIKMYNRVLKSEYKIRGLKIKEI